MAPRQTKSNIQKVRRQPSARKDQGKQLKGIQKVPSQIPSRRSARLKGAQLHQEQRVLKDKNTESSSKTSYPPIKEIPQAKDRKRKRLQPEEPPLQTTTTLFPKRRRTSVPQSAAEGRPSDEEAASNISKKELDLIEQWRKEGRWPKEYFKQDDQTRKDLEKDSWYEKYWVPEMNHLLARKKSASSLRGKQSAAGSVTPSSATPSDQKSREVKSAPYKDPRYRTILATKGSFMSESKLGITDKSKANLQAMLSIEQIVPRDSLFRDDIFKSTCEKIQDRNETRVVRDISLLIVPSAETFATFGAKNLEILIETVNEGWNNSIPITPTRPQPDYSVGFRREAFTEDQLKRIKPIVGELTDTSYFMATYYMYFPFLTCEVKCGAAALDVADRQNAHSTTMAVRGIVELFRIVKREKELHREILTFSISHDHSSIRIYGHYALIDGIETTFYRHPIHKFDFTALDGKEKWTTYKFTKNVYDIWMPAHFKRICSVINDLPSDLNFDVSERSGLESGLSQGLESHYLSDHSSHDTASLLEEDDSQSSCAASRDITPDTSLSHRANERAHKRPRKRERPVELH